MADSISAASDSELLSIAIQMEATMMGSPVDYHLTVAQLTPLTEAKDNFTVGLAEHADAQANAKMKTQGKNDMRSVLEDVMRSLRNVAKAANTSEAAMNNLGLPVSSAPAPASATQPKASVDTSQRLRHTISWTDQAANGSKKKPRGAMGAEIWVKIDGPPPGSEKDCTFVAVDSATPYVAEYDATQGGKLAHYMLRWRMRDGTLGSWGETVSATITA